MACRDIHVDRGEFVAMVTEICYHGDRADSPPPVDCLSWTLRSLLSLSLNKKYPHQELLKFYFMD